MFSENDILYMRRALQLAKLGGVYAAPNPLVGAVIVHNDIIIGEGYHQLYGEAHAEVNAVNEVKDKTLLPSSTIYVTLEPCAHQGKTPPCADLLVKHNFMRVVVACKDTFSEVSGKGIEKMKHSGINVELGLLESEARNLNKRFFTFHEEKRPYVILKWAQTLDGYFDKVPKKRGKGVNWITSSITKPLVHQWRAEEQAIMVGWKTVANDNPSLTVREVSGKSPARFIIDPHCQTSLDAKVIQDGHSTTFLVKRNNYSNLPEHVNVLEIDNFSSQGILEYLFSIGIISVFIEGGAHTLQHFIDNNLWDEARVLTGDVKFEKGLKAPEIGQGRITSSEKLGTNTVTYIKRS